MKKINNINTDKLNRQLIGLERWWNSGSLGFSYKDRAGCLNYFTGVGKTFTALLIIDKYFKEFPNSTIVILVPNEHLVKQWMEVLKEAFYRKELDFIKVYTADYILTNKLIINVRLLIVDELDGFYSEKRIHLLKKKYIIYVDILGLTSTYEDIKLVYLEIKKFIPIVDKIGEKEALAKGYISKYLEYNLGLSFSFEEQEAHTKFSKEIREGLSKFGKGSLDLAMKCLSGGKTKDGIKRTSTFYCNAWAKYNKWHFDLNLNNSIDREINDLWNPRMIFAYAVNLMRSIKRRKELIYTSSSKLDVAVQILEKFLNTKTIIFSQSTVFADTLYGIINELHPDNAVIYHSQIKTQMLPSPVTGKLIKYGKTRLKNRAMERINNNTSNHLITSSVLDKGLDIPDLKLGVTTSGTQNPTQYKQRKGRPIRLDTNSPESVAIIVNLYIKSSKEVTWLKNRQAKSNNIIYWITSVDQISYKPKLITNEISIDDI